MNIVKSILLLFLAISNSSCQLDVRPIELNYEDMILLDAENLAETGIGAAYNELLPSLSRYIPNPIQIEERIDNDLPRYAIRANGKEYVVYDSDTPEYESWGIATYVFFEIINDQLKDKSVRLYAINNGHDLGAMYLTSEQAKSAQLSLPNPTDWPYLPEATSPWYGQHH